ncbi:winged helix-turn-helix transcriptional regulator [Actinospica durhamensis]|uniref:Winged helix-turn-helix transcriptional regulator n=1 Tax=Actinospica durhamensis TaxID=1508375 RepID=A0A941ESA8_9ACTN|nr:MarR family winged helix-turn-helix transcriptional regulator [Actinospica durhamensis]MBR7832924.1 winged helix-turn-helix transcriptional regulator [Actinospica durhamensis]
MARATGEVEFEQMVLSRFGLASHGRVQGRLLEKSAYILLSRISLQGPMSIGEISEAFDLDTSTVNRQTGAAMKAGLVERIADPAGGMARKFRITELGQQHLDQDRDFNVRALDAVMADWPEADIAQFALLLRRFNSGIERLGSQPWPRTDGPDASKV